MLIKAIETSPAKNGEKQTGARGSIGETGLVRGANYYRLEGQQ